MEPRHKADTAPSERAWGKSCMIAKAAPACARALRRQARNGRFARMAVVGSAETARALKRELELASDVRSRVVGRIGADGPVFDDPEMPVLGRLDELGRIVARHRVDLIVISGEVPRLRVFDQALAAGEPSFRVCELSEFYEAVFGHVPTAEIDASWFDYLVHPTYPDSELIKRALDIVGALLLALVLLPALALVALLIRLDGGPALFRQARIGEGGRPITVYKLRTMRGDGDSAARWSSSSDPRVTALGRFLRRNHLDEAPQLYNVLRGEMSLVGPRPEQPEFVSRLEDALPFYQRRHLVKPGITGWAQIRCGYAGSDVGSAWKLCHDLYYMKYRSLRLDLLILAQTLRLVLFAAPTEIEESRPLAALIAEAAMPSAPRLGVAAPGAVDAGLGLKPALAGPVKPALAAPDYSSSVSSARTRSSISSRIRRTPSRSSSAGSSITQSS